MATISGGAYDGQGLGDRKLGDRKGRPYEGLQNSQWGNIFGSVLETVSRNDATF